jgi:hypothetical protein
LSVKSIVRLEKRVKFTGIEPFKALLVKLIDIHLPSVLVFFNNVEGIVPVKLLLEISTCENLIVARIIQHHPNPYLLLGYVQI